MDSEKQRLVLAVFLITGFLFFWYSFIAPPPKPKPIPTQAPTPEAKAPTPSAATEQGAIKIEQAPEKPIEASVPRKQIRRETGLLDMKWDNQGGVLAELKLKKHRTKMERDAGPVSVVPFEENAEPPALFSYRLDGVTYEDRFLHYELEAAEDQKIVFFTKLPNGVHVRKIYTWSEEAYPILLTLEAENSSERAIGFEPETKLSLTYGPKPKSSLFSARKEPTRAVALINDATNRWSGEDAMKGEEIPKGSIEWAGFDSQYFLMALIPVEGRWQEMRMKATPQDGKPDEAKALDILLKYPTQEIFPGSKASVTLKFMGGPKDIGILSAGFENLDRAIDLGDWLGPIARAILKFLRWLNGFIGNYGIAILVLTVLVRLALFPLTQMQAKSMKKMQTHKPQLDALKEKFGENKEAYSRELMNYMRTHKINPMGGCLLILPQMPIFFALYRVLYNSIELRHAPFAFWIQDLSAPDPYFVTPLLLGVVMFFQQKLTPMPTAEPAQQTMMKIMPVMFTVFMLFLPAGLNLYIFVSTLWGVGQQLWVQKLSTQLESANKSGTRKNGTG